MTIIEWRQNKERVRAAHKILTDPTMREMLELLQAENPVYYPLGKASNSDDRSAQLGRIEGACYVISALKSMGELLEKKGFLKQTYQDAKPD